MIVGIVSIVGIAGIVRIASHPSDWILELFDLMIEEYNFLLVILFLVLELMG